MLVNSSGAVEVQNSNRTTILKMDKNKMMESMSNAKQDELKIFNFEGQNDCGRIMTAKSLETSIF